MEGRVQEISRELIKPSSATPNHLKKLKLSYIDQLVPPMYVPLIFFYQADESSRSSNHVQTSQQLKQSLSNTLTSFYPLAGRVDHNFVVDCNDSGVEFIDARVDAHLMDVIQYPNLEELKQYLPLDPTKVGLGEGPLLLVQITFFNCGGIAIGVCFSHQLADCASATAFFNAWAATCRGEADISRFSFDTANYFPPRDFSDSSSLITGFNVSNEKLVTKRFVFDKEKMALLKQAATSPSESTVKDPSRVELVSAFIWKHFTELAKFNNNLKEKKIFGAFHAVNLRKRRRPPQQLENVFGNCILQALALSEGVDEQAHDLVSKLRSAIRKINDDYITRAQNGDGYLNDVMELSSQLMKGELECCSFSSWCGFPVYEVDYGWGRPIWLCTTAVPIKNCIALVSSKSGDGIEAMVTMTQDDLQKFETLIDQTRFQY